MSADQRTRERASVDEATMSPILSEQLPLGLADLVASPASADEVAATLEAAIRHGVPVTTRGKGTGNYGQGIPLHGGLVLDTSRARAVVEVGDGWITAEAGTTMVALEQAAAANGQQLWMYPSTAQSTIGGFLSGGLRWHRIDRARVELAGLRDRARHRAARRSGPAARRGRRGAALRAHLRHGRRHRPSHGPARTTAGLAGRVRVLPELRAGARGRPHPPRAGPGATPGQRRPR
ncbi:FAD-binding oxidoreductase [Curtobacterium sp. MCPF17_052]|uniref:FAD-binding oxidoreductase n=1 Tax=Curtobacterium sp. MCPF17_052 TaxID=2175655 RepID=UPI0024DFE153|nr:FAD-dependent oxidoreductase [Curtobacterium sp. MCPF17_052]WIB13279.1 FAD-dependent oxidoreductase [Curtobacterium sp. MCPF17_052]